MEASGNDSARGKGGQETFLAAFLAAGALAGEGAAAGAGAGAAFLGADFLAAAFLGAVFLAVTFFGATFLAGEAFLAAICDRQRGNKGRQNSIPASKRLRSSCNGRATGAEARIMMPLVRHSLFRNETSEREKRLL